MWFHDAVVELIMRISVAILTLWAGEVGVSIFPFIYFLLQGCEELFHFFLGIVYIWLVLPVVFAWPAGSKLFFILILIGIILGISLSMGCWVAWLVVVVAPLVFMELLVIVFIFFLFMLPFWANATPSDVVWLTTVFLVYLSKIWRVVWCFLGMFSSPVAKFFWRLVFSFLCYLPLCLSKTYDEYLSSGYSFTSSCSSLYILSYLVLDSWAKYSSRTFCCLVTPMEYPISTLVLNLLYHWSLVRLCWWKL